MASSGAMWQKYTVRQTSMSLDWDMGHGAHPRKKYGESMSGTMLMLTWIRFKAMLLMWTLSFTAQAADRSAFLWSIP